MWAVNPGANIYANISSVFETPTFTELANVAIGGFANVSAQKTLNQEIGMKDSVNARLSDDVAAFHIDVEDEIINIGGRSFFNNADTTRNGVEATVSFIPVTV